jgi:hypothetical protein
VLIESQRFHSQGQSVVPPPFGRLQSQTRPCSASMFPSGNFEVTLGTSWVLCRGLALKAELQAGRPLGWAFHTLLLGWRWHPLCPVPTALAQRLTPLSKPTLFCIRRRIGLLITRVLRALVLLEHLLFHTKSWKHWPKPRLLEKGSCHCRHSL